MLLFHGSDLFQRLFFCFYRPAATDKSGLFLYKFIFTKLGRYQIFVQIYHLFFYSWRLPRQFENWLAMTPFFISFLW